MDHPVASHADWLAARKELLAREKEFSQAREKLARQRRDLPWEEVTKEYVFEGPDGRRTLAELFDGRGQLVIYHFMFTPGWDAGCPHCSFWADNFDGAVAHLNARDVTLTAVSRAPVEQLTAYQQRMGWSFPWVSSGGSDFNFDFGVSFTPEQLASGAAAYNYGSAAPGQEDREGTSVFAADGTGRVFHTYSTYARGIDMVNGTYQFLDLVPKGRDEPAAGNPQFWVRRHDEYGG